MVVDGAARVKSLVENMAFEISHIVNYYSLCPKRNEMFGTTQSLRVIKSSNFALSLFTMCELRSTIENRGCQSYLFVTDKSYDQSRCNADSHVC